MSATHSDFTSAMTAYAMGTSHQYPNTQGVPTSVRKRMDTLRQNFLLHQLENDPVAAHQLPDFYWQLQGCMSAEAKVLQKTLFADWDTYVQEAPRFRDSFTRIENDLHREWKDLIDAGRPPRIKHRYLSINAKRLAFRAAMKEAAIRGELELVCFGQLRFGTL